MDVLKQMYFGRKLTIYNIQVNGISFWINNVILEVLPYLEALRKRREKFSLDINKILGEEVNTREIFTLVLKIIHGSVYPKQEHLVGSNHACYLLEYFSVDFTKVSNKSIISSLRKIIFPDAERVDLEDSIRMVKKSMNDPLGEVFRRDLGNFFKSFATFKGHFFTIHEGMRNLLMDLHNLLEIHGYWNALYLLKICENYHGLPEQVLQKYYPQKGNITFIHFTITFPEEEELIIHMSNVHLLPFRDVVSELEDFGTYAAGDEFPRRFWEIIVMKIYGISLWKKKMKGLDEEDLAKFCLFMMKFRAHYYEFEEMMKKTTDISIDVSEQSSERVNVFREILDSEDRERLVEFMNEGSFPTLICSLENLERGGIL